MTKIMACLEEELPPGRRRDLGLLGRTVLTANVGGRYFAVGGLCTYAGANLADVTASTCCPRRSSSSSSRTGRRTRS